MANSEVESRKWHSLLNRQAQACARQVLKVKIDLLCIPAVLYVTIGKRYVPWLIRNSLVCNLQVEGYFLGTNAQKWFRSVEESELT